MRLKDLDGIFLVVALTLSDSLHVLGGNDHEGMDNCDSKLYLYQKYHDCEEISRLVTEYYPSVGIEESFAAQVGEYKKCQEELLDCALMFARNEAKKKNIEVELWLLQEGRNDEDTKKLLMEVNNYTNKRKVSFPIRSWRNIQQRDQENETYTSWIFSKAVSTVSYVCSSLYTWWTTPSTEELPEDVVYPGGPDFPRKKNKRGHNVRFSLQNLIETRHTYEVDDEKQVKQQQQQQQQQTTTNK
ncbi:uncharacterized protein LOC129001081 [Macrosteles quadrilineatus]|uniref:uncharacterized protein LOC129001081 n=1 Tax=Macrosteles quadrilineatus TaxID=74068 RepID=UPI0023E2FA36|nr:uncharacterized protein LOC129001081 [Macrosteles quadrilineatus]